MPRTVLKVCGGGWWWWLRPILVFSLSLDQAEQNLKFGYNVSILTMYACAVTKYTELIYDL